MKYAPLLFDPSQTAGFEVSEINLLVVKLTPEASERAIAIPAIAGGGQSGSGSGAAGEPDDDAPTMPRHPIDAQLYVAQRQSTAPPERVVVPLENIVAPGRQPATQAERGWSYVGTFRKGAYHDLTFHVPEGTRPADLKGKTLTARTDVFVRNDKPRFMLGWRLGDRLGVLKEGAQLEVREVAEIPAQGGGVRVWVRS